MVSIPAYCPICHPWGGLLHFTISPGRLFVTGELKLLLAHLVVTYDLKFEEGKGVPPELRVATLCVPGTSDVMFRKRQK